MRENKVVNVQYMEGMLNPSRREFIQEAAVIGAVTAAGGEAAEERPEMPEKTGTSGEEQCPYFDQPLYCKGMSDSGKRLCEE